MSFENIFNAAFCSIDLIELSKALKIVSVEAKLFDTVDLSS